MFPIIMEPIVFPHCPYDSFISCFSHMSMYFELVHCYRFWCIQNELEYSYTHGNTAWLLLTPFLTSLLNFLSIPHMDTTSSDMQINTFRFLRKFPVHFVEPRDGLGFELSMTSAFGPVKVRTNLQRDSWISNPSNCAVRSKIYLNE